MLAYLLKFLLPCSSTCVDDSWIAAMSSDVSIITAFKVFRCRWIIQKSQPQENISSLNKHKEKECCVSTSKKECVFLNSTTLPNLSLHF
ncbi:hypothetical protein NPIL_697631 [Nephila pilipes]|uniref:Secreted protein n=1 Tax=Nephila pilipes TaxID=299642 RepID=A0A8X6NSG5_NEPPI|nr:hypothetical protein NPIL_697631 [Nephila pilipes]